MEYTFENRSTEDNITPRWLDSGLGAEERFNFYRYGRLLPNVDFMTNDLLAITSGSFANLSQYFGLTLAETASRSIRAGSWGSDEAYSVIYTPPSSFWPWFTRGGDASYISRAGVFAYTAHRGGIVASVTFRPILAGS